MAAEQPKRRGTNWAEARDFWLALQPPRSFQTVADQYRVSRSRVRYVAVREGWEALAADVDARALENAKRRIVRSRADRVTKVLGIIDGLVDRYDDELAQLELKPADLDRVVKLGELLQGEATDRVEFGEVKDAFVRFGTRVLGWLPKEFHERFLGELRDELGGVA